jgi:hypothetical protein
MQLTLTKSLGKVERSMTRFGRKDVQTLALRLTQSLDITYYRTWCSSSKILCRHGKAAKWINSHYGK